ncbi:alanine dehydrogenase [Desulforamulus aeronauticus]|uniref:Alanine dehydrogenase n=2 Tax=Desulforamulus aeronauticus DSM 10349 TaxID=1121421 RepID=A0A1M6XH97_9FIRM|nr:alanine dehydrogenase [Desulforamulus aeronauticus]SHL05283.1 alanine dehydrogenase [Desulforamulus aeronauticus DSM 10349]
MIVGVPKEIKNNENRVAMTPAGVKAMIDNGHQVIIENNAGLGSGITNEEYIAAGAKIMATAKEVFDGSDMIMKVKEPLKQEYGLFKEGQLLFTYLHLAPEPELTAALLEKKVTGIAYETIQLDNGALPLLSPMSEVAGRMSVQIGAHLLEKTFGGKGVLLGGVPGVPAAKVVVVGGGIVGTNAAKMAMGLGADVTIIDVSVDRLRYLDDIFGGRIKTMMSNSYNIAAAVKEADLLVGAVLIPGAKAPKLVKEDMVKTMKPGSVIVDVAIDQGGSIETIDRVTTHDNPSYEKYGVVHYSVANMPGAVARTSTYALTNVTLPYAVQLANKGWVQAVKDNGALAKGVNVAAGKCTYKAVADDLGLEYTCLCSIIS